MKEVFCSYSKCGNRRKNFESDKPRGKQKVQVPDDYDESKPVYCSIECLSYDGKKLKEKKK